MPDADVIIVGFRCAGAPLGYALHKAGVKVIVVDKDPFFSDQAISTHAIQPFGMKVFDRLGLGDVVRQLAPPNSAFRFQVEESYLQIDLNGTDLDSRSPRRCKLDPALQKAALDAGVDARDKTSVANLLTEGDRVVGVRLDHAGTEYELRAPLVVGADGRNSTIAKLVGAVSYLEAKSTAAMYWSYFEKTPVFDDDPRYRWGACIHIERDEARAVFQTDSGLLLIAGGGRRAQLETWRGDPTASLMAHLQRGALTAPLLEGSRMIQKPMGVLSLSYFMKQGVGPGWALVGDSGLHMDPTPGLGITDAVRDAAALSEAIIEGTEKAMLLYWRRRDADSLGLYHFAADMGSDDYNNALTRMLFRRSMVSPEIGKRMLAMMDRQLRPQDMLPPGRLLGWLALETLSGNFGPMKVLPRVLKNGSRIVRQQLVLDRLLKRAQGGEMNYSVPSLPQ